MFRMKTRFRNRKKYGNFKFKSKILEALISKQQESTVKKRKKS